MCLNVACSVPASSINSFSLWVHYYSHYLQATVYKMQVEHLQKLAKLSDIRPHTGWWSWKWVCLEKFPCMVYWTSWTSWRLLCTNFARMKRWSRRITPTSTIWRKWGWDKNELPQWTELMRTHNQCMPGAISITSSTDYWNWQQRRYENILTAAKLPTEIKWIKLLLHFENV